LMNFVRKAVSKIDVPFYDINLQPKEASKR
jgi:hypothetical protein